MKAAQDSWRMKEEQLLAQIEQLKFEKTKALEKNGKLVASLEEKAKSMCDGIVKSAEDEWKWKENILHMEMRLRNLVASLEKEKMEGMRKAELLNGRGTEKKLLLKNLESLENNEGVAELQIQLKEKTEEVKVGKQQQEKLLQQIEQKDLSLMTERKKPIVAMHSGWEGVMSIF